MFKTRVTDMLGIEYPIICGGMQWLGRAKRGKSHLRRKKAKRTKNLFDKKVPVSPADARRIMRLLPYGVP